MRDFNPGDTDSLQIAQEELTLRIIVGRVVYLNAYPGATNDQGDPLPQGATELHYTSAEWRKRVQAYPGEADGEAVLAEMAVNSVIRTLTDPLNMSMN